MSTLGTLQALAKPMQRASSIVICGRLDVWIRAPEHDSVPNVAHTRGKRCEWVRNIRHAVLLRRLYPHAKTGYLALQLKQGHGMLNLYVETPVCRCCDGGLRQFMQVSNLASCSTRTQTDATHPHIIMLLVITLRIPGRKRPACEVGLTLGFIESWAEFSARHPANASCNTQHTDALRRCGY
jgi:hypothetical protein